MATIREIAKRVGFSQATVSRVLKDDPTFSVKDSTREKILNASLEMGYKNVPQYQRITIPQDVAILDNVVPDKGLQDAYFDELREVLVKHAEEQRMNVTMHEDVDSLIADADKYAGFISIGPSPLNHKTLHRLHKKLPPRRIHRHQSCAGIVRFGTAGFGTNHIGCDRRVYGVGLLSDRLHWRLGQHYGQA